VADSLERLRQFVLTDPALCRVLVGITDRDEFTATLTALARVLDLTLEVSDIDGAMVAARRLWLERWI
jgi:hypothetical protein